MSATTRPDRSEAADYYFTYIDQVEGADIVGTLEIQAVEALAVLETVGEAQSLHRYAPGKWSVRQVMSHVNDTERIFTHRALWFARGFDSPLAGFDQDVAVAGAYADSRSWRSHLDELRAVRAATVALFRDLPADAWARGGVASGNPVTVRALAFMTAGHLTHHLRIVRERYLDGA